MKRADVEIGGVYIAKVSNRKTRVKILRVSRRGGWDALNVYTDRLVYIKTAARLSKINKWGAKECS